MTDTIQERLSILRSYPQKRVDAVIALETIVSYDGDITMAAAELETSPQMVIAAIVGTENSHDLLAKYLRAYTMTKTFSLVNQLAEAVQENIPNMRPSDVATTLTKLVDGMARLTDTPAAPPLDAYAALMRFLPAEDREAFKVLADTKPTEINNESAA